MNNLFIWLFQKSQEMYIFFRVFFNKKDISKSMRKKEKKPDLVLFRHIFIFKHKGCVHTFARIVCVQYIIGTDPLLCESSY